MPTARAPYRIAPALAAALFVAAAHGALADEVVLKSGGRVSGVIVSRTNDAVVIETGPGRVTLPLARVERIVEGRSALAAYRERAAALSPNDARGWADLARWAEDSGHTTQSREAWERVLELEPGHPQANAALGRMQVDGRWMAAHDAYRAQGYVQYDGRWVTPVEHEALLRERAAEDAARREQRENEARIREAEARAAEAEARAREAEMTAQPYDDGGVPYWWWGYGGGGIVVPPIADWPDGRPPAARPPGVRPPAPRPPAAARPPASSSGGSGTTRPAKPHHSGGVAAPRPAAPAAAKP